MDFSGGGEYCEAVGLLHHSLDIYEVFSGYNIGIVILN